jgi:hypothetical protein
MSENNNKLNLTEISQRIHQTDFVDGFVFIFIGFVLLITAGIVNFNFTLGPLLVVIVVELLRPSVSEELRKRFTYPRIGVFKVKISHSSLDYVKVFSFIIAVSVISILIILISEGGNFNTLHNNIWRYGPIVVGLLLFGPSYDLVNRTGQNRYYGIGLFSTLLGILSFFTDFSQPKQGFMIYLTLLGVLFIILGFFMFIRFIQTHPLISDDEVIIPTELEK